MSSVPNWRERYELVKGAERERCVDAVLEELDRASEAIRAKGGPTMGMQLAVIMRLRDVLPSAMRRQVDSVRKTS